MFFKRMLEDLGVEMTIVPGRITSTRVPLTYFRKPLRGQPRAEHGALEDFWARMGDIAQPAERPWQTSMRTSMRWPCGPRETFWNSVMDALLYEDELHAMLLEKGAAEDEDEASHAALPA